MLHIPGLAVLLVTTREFVTNSPCRHSWSVMMISPTKALSISTRKMLASPAAPHSCSSNSFCCWLKQLRRHSRAKSPLVAGACFGSTASKQRPLVLGSWLVVAWASCCPCASKRHAGAMPSAEPQNNRQVLTTLHASCTMYVTGTAASAHLHHDV